MEILRLVSVNAICNGDTWCVAGLMRMVGVDRFAVVAPFAIPVRVLQVPLDSLVVKGS